MSFSDYSLTPASNTTIGGVNVAENCPPANLNNAIRQLAADGKELADEIEAMDDAMPETGGAFTGDIARQGKGAYLHFASSALTNGQAHVLAEGAALPAAAEGVLVFFYV